MDFSSLVLMEMDPNTKLFIKEIGSYKIEDGAQYIKKMYYDGEKVNVQFDTNKDVEDWEYTAIYDVFNYDIFKESGFEIEDIDDEYNPAWRVKLDFIEDHDAMDNKLCELCRHILKANTDAAEDIKGKEDSYK